eukprot:scaffold3747_cov99-Cylindrotheca_fusiformis.AAC.4
MDRQKRDLLSLLLEEEEEDLEIIGHFLSDLQLLIKHRQKKRRNLVKQTRAPKFAHQRIDFEAERQKYVESSETFESRYHLKEETYDKLFEILEKDITFDTTRSRASTTTAERPNGNTPITPHHVLMVGLRFLGGDSKRTLADVVGISSASVDRCINTFLEAIENCRDLDIKLPSTTDEIHRHVDEWTAISTARGAFHGFVGAIDGWLCAINKPTCPNPADYFSGHYKCFVVAPGKCNDNRAFQRCTTLQRWIYELPPGVFLGGDNAYTLEDTMMIPFSGSQRQEPINRTYNFLFSQLRIRIEMAFGLLTTKWRIFRRNLDCSVTKNCMIIKAAARLHNFVIDAEDVNYRTTSLDDLLRSGQVLAHQTQNTTTAIGYMANNLPTRDDCRLASEVGGQIRDRIVSEIADKGLTRPEHNMNRNNNGAPPTNGRGDGEETTAAV